MKQKEIREAFRAADRLGAGLLDAKGVFGALAELKFPAISKTRINTFIATLGSEGYIDIDGFKEMVDEMMKGDDDTNGTEQLDHVFGILSNSAGFITLDSLEKASQQEGFSLEELRDMLNEADTNHDGMIDRLEFENVWKRAGMT